MWVKLGVSKVLLISSIMLDANTVSLEPDQTSQVNVSEDELQASEGSHHSGWALMNRLLRF